MPDLRELLREAVGPYEPGGDLRRVERRVDRRHRVRRVAAGVVALGVFVAAGWLGWTTLRPVQGLRGGAASGTPAPTATGGPAEPIDLGPIPEAGVAVGSVDAVELVALDGTTVATLRGFVLTGNPGAPGVWLLREGTTYALDVGGHALIPLRPDAPPGQMYDEGPRPDLPLPARVGHWRYALESPSGTTLGQWSGECEVPAAYWIEPDGPPRIVTGERDASTAPTSLALGWSSQGDAIVLVGSGACGGGARQPGIYRFAGPGAGRLVVGTGAAPVTADAWGTGI